MTSTTNPPRVLVVAPRFPSINQPWMDTYLEQLLRNGFEVRILSELLARDEELVYQSRVDDLGLLDLVLPQELLLGGQGRSIVSHWFRNPIGGTVDLFRAAAMAWRGVMPHTSWLRAWVGLFYLLGVFRRLGRIDLVHTHSETAGYSVVSMARALRIPSISTFHGLPPTGYQQLTSEQRHHLYASLEFVLLNTRFASGQLVSLGGLDDRIRILPQGLPLERFPYHPTTLQQPLRLFTVGRFHGDKGHRFALAACARLRKAGCEFRYDIAGVGPNRRNIERAITRLGLEDCVEIHEFAPEKKLAELYTQAHVFILPSITPNDVSHIETQGVVLQEAQASGCMVIATRTGGIPECLHHEEDALLVDERSSRSIFAALDRIIESPDQWDQWLRNGRRNVEENYSAEVIGDRVTAMLRETINPR